MKTFFADYDVSPHPKMFEALRVLENRWVGGKYGDDACTHKAHDLVRQLFCLNSDAGIFLVPSGSAANHLAIATILPRSFDAVVAMSNAHINVHEAGSVEALGHKVLPVRGFNGRIMVGDLYDWWKTRNDIHQVRPAAMSISQATEWGRVYSHDNLQSITDWLFTKNMSCHIDGARLSNAAAHLKTKNLRSLTFDGAADVVTFGFAKNGGLSGDVVIIPDPALAAVATRYHKQFGYLAPRMQPQAVQITAMLTDDLWYRNATQANAMATLLGAQLLKEFQIDPLYPIESNAVFATLPFNVIAGLTKEGFGLVWDAQENVMRFMCAWCTTEEDVSELIGHIKGYWP